MQPDKKFPPLTLTTNNIFTPFNKNKPQIVHPGNLTNIVFTLQETVMELQPVLISKERVGDKVMRGAISETKRKSCETLSVNKNERMRRAECSSQLDGAGACRY